ncbi:MAG TPA: nucleotide exchange factor GrpE [Kofleriaceae bacterium]|nr:nucleotide exchange factor GrpE [Kofleriaceae bacterium]
MADSDSPDFDAVAAAKELDDLLGGTDTDTTAEADYVASLEDDVEALNAAIAKKDAELRAANQRADQAHAEIEAAGKRMANASAKELEQKSRKMLESFLEVVDDLDRAIAAAKGTAAKDLVEGIELVRRNMLTRLGQFGVVHAPARGEPFDPKRHDAVALVPVTDPAQDGRVIDVMREGYLVGEETLRPASVAVGKRNH